MATEFRSLLTFTLPTFIKVLIKAWWNGRVVHKNMRVFLLHVLIVSAFFYVSCNLNFVISKILWLVHGHVQWQKSLTIWYHKIAPTTGCEWSNIIIIFCDESVVDCWSVNITYYVIIILLKQICFELLNLDYICRCRNYWSGCKIVI